MESDAVVAKRKLTNEDVLKYEPMVEKFIRDSCVKNWSTSRILSPDSFLGSSGYSLNDVRQHLRTEVCVALQNYNPGFKTKEGRTVKESTFVYQHLTFRVGQMMKRLTKRRQGYGVHHAPIQNIQKGVEESMAVDMDLVLSMDERRALHSKESSQVEQFLEKTRIK